MLGISRRKFLIGSAVLATFPVLPRPAFATGEYPLSIAGVTLRVSDILSVSSFYETTVGLSRLSSTEDRVVLGAGGRALLTLERSSYVMPDDRTAAGLYHTAFLLPSRKDLALWLGRAFLRSVVLDGLSDHGVSEAIYLSDPEGNGVEIYADRSASQWVWDGDEVRMGTSAFDIDGLIELVPDRDEAAAYVLSTDTTVGHVHLRVGDVSEASAFYSGLIGFDTVRSREGAEFLSTGRYHHHLAVNVWESSGASTRDDRRNGLARLDLHARSPQSVDEQVARLRQSNHPVHVRTDGFETIDPWGTKVRVVLA